MTTKKKETTKVLKAKLNSLGSLALTGLQSSEVSEKQKILAAIYKEIVGSEKYHEVKKVLGWEE